MSRSAGRWSVAENPCRSGGFHGGIAVRDDETIVDICLDALTQISATRKALEAVARALWTIS